MQKVSIFGVSRGERGNLHQDGNSRPTFSSRNSKRCSDSDPEQQAGGGPGKFFQEGQGGCQSVELCKVLLLGLGESMAWTQGLSLSDPVKYLLREIIFLCQVICRQFFFILF